MIRVCLVSGLLGAGKTTWLAGELAAATSTTRVVVNDVADDMPDADLLAGPRTDRIVGGCICCDRADELAALLRRLCADVHGGADTQRIVIETSGVSDPTAVAELIRTDPVLTENLLLDEVVVVVDALFGARSLRHDRLAAGQVLAADRLVISKSDLCQPAPVTALVADLRASAPTAHVEVTPNPHGLDPMAIAPAADVPVAQDSHETPPAVAVTIDLEPDVDWVVLAAWLAALLHTHGESVLRLKGVVNTPNGTLVLNAVHGVMHAPRHRAEPVAAPGLTAVVTGLTPQGVAAGWARFRDAARSARPDQEVRP